MENKEEIMRTAREGQTVWEARMDAHPVFCKSCGHQTRLDYKPSVEKYTVNRIARNPNGKPIFAELKQEDPVFGKSYMQICIARSRDFFAKRSDAMRKAITFCNAKNDNEQKAATSRLPKQSA